MTEMSKEYASALYDLSMDLHAENETLSALKLVQQTLSETPDAVAVLCSPAIPKKNRLALIEQTWGERVPEHVLSYLCVLCGRGAFRSFNRSVEDFEALHMAAQKICTAVVTSAQPLSGDELTRLRNGLEKKLGRKITLVCRTDASLLGGLVVNVDGKVMDGSLKHRLHEIKEVMKK